MILLIHKKYIIYQIPILAKHKFELVLTGKRIWITSIVVFSYRGIEVCDCRNQNRKQI